ncbi:MAG: hypothetical protein V4474_04365 [Patescibacteria group bacterium]
MSLGIVIVVALVLSCGLGAALSIAQREWPLHAGGLAAGICYFLACWWFKATPTGAFVSVPTISFVIAAALLPLTVVLGAWLTEPPLPGQKIPDPV